MFPVGFSSKDPLKKPADAAAQYPKLQPHQICQTPSYLQVATHTNCVHHMPLPPQNRSWPLFLMFQGLICPKLPHLQLLESPIFSFFWL